MHSVLNKNPDQKKEESEIELDDITQPHYQYALISIMSSYRESDALTKLKGLELKNHSAREKRLKNQYKWKALETSEALEINSCGYFGVAYYKINKETNTAEVVIGHRGTCFDQMGNVLADLDILQQKKPSILEEAALLYANKIYEKYSGGVPNKETVIPVSKITHVGFSLGGYIAAVCALSANNVFAITFDAPGCNYLGDFNKQASSKIINYVTTPNLVNTANMHIGEVRRLASFPEINKAGYRYEGVPLKLEILNLNTLQQLLSTIESHCLEKIIVDAEKLSVFRYEKVYKWPTAKNEAVYEQKPQKNYSYLPGGNFFVNTGYVLFQLGTSVASDILWDMTKRISPNGKQEGLVAVKHERNDLIFYTKEAYDHYIESIFSSSSANVTNQFG